jgi:four helix bundle protein
MASVKRFEDLECWKEARVLVRQIYELTKKKKFSMDFELKNQIRRSAVSTMANTAEGFHRYSNKDFMKFLDYSRSSIAETLSHAYVALDQGYIPNPRKVHSTRGGQADRAVLRLRGAGRRAARALRAVFWKGWEGLEGLERWEGENKKRKWEQGPAAALRRAFAVSRRRVKRQGTAADGFTLLNLAFSEPASQNSTGQGQPQTTFFPAWEKNQRRRTTVESAKNEDPVTSNWHA